MRLGVPVSVLGRARLKSHDARRPEQCPHLSVSLLYVRDILEYLSSQNIRMYRMSPYLAPYLSHPQYPQFHNQIDECQTELAYIGALARCHGLRLSIHAMPYTTLSAEDEGIVGRSAHDLDGWAHILDAMEMGPESVIVLHVGGVYGDLESAKARFIRNLDRLPAYICRRLALENDDHAYHIGHILSISERTGLPVVLDYMHFLVHNPDRISFGEALGGAWRTWPADVRPKLHFSTPRTELRPIRSQTAAGLMHTPQWTEHADFVNPFEFIHFARQLPDRRQVDVMIEAKAKDLAVMRLMADVRRYAPDLAGDID